MTQELAVKITVGSIALDGDLTYPDRAGGVVLFAHGSGSSRHSPRNRSVAEALQRAGFATLLMDLLTAQEEEIDAHTAHLRFDIELLAGRLVAAVGQVPGAGKDLPIGLFGASTGAAAALVAAARLPHDVAAVVSRGGRPDLAGDALGEVAAPTLLIVGGNDPAVLEMNRSALDRMTCERRLEVVPGASHLFEEPGTLEQVAELARDWFAASFDAAGTLARANSES